MRLKLIILIVLVFQLPLHIKSKESPLDMRHLETLTSLSNTKINSVYKDSRGFLWIGTSSGLCRYDGYSVKMHREDHPEGTSVLNNYVGEIQEDGAGRLWIYAEGKYRIYDPDTGELIDNLVPYLKEKGIEGDVTDVCAGENAIWIAVSGKGVYVLRNGADRGVLASGDILKGKRVSDIDNAGSSIVCVATDGSLTFVNPETLKVEMQIDNPMVKSIEPDSDYFYEMYADKDGRIWVFHNDILTAYDCKANRWLADALPSKERIGVVKNIFQDHKGRMWIARDHCGLAQMLKTKDGFEIEDYDESGELKGNNTIICFNEDKDGTLWIGTYKQGLFSYNESVDKFELIELGDVNCMVPADGQNMWVGTDSSGVLKWNPVDNTCHKVSESGHGSLPATITSMATSKDGTLYIGSFSKGLTKYKDGVFPRIVTNSSLDDNFAWGLTFDKDGNLWVGTLGAGLYKIDTATGETVEYNDANSGLSNNYVLSLICLRDGKIYIGTSYGLSIYDPQTGKIESHMNEPDEINLSHRVFTQIYEDSRGLIWIATGSGLKVIDRKRKSLQDIKLRDDKSQYYILGIIEDNGGSMWVAEGAYLINLKVKYDPHSGELGVSPIVYDQADGVQNCEFNQRSFAKLLSGDIVVGGLYGITRFSPYDMKFNTSCPKVMFTDISMSSHKIMIGEEVDGRIVMDKGLNQGVELQFNHNPEEFTVYFATDNYALPQKTVFKYKLEGYNDTWITAPRGVNHVTYTNLSPGHYSLLVKAINGDGYESESAASLKIYVHPPFWATPVAYVFYVLMVLCVVYFVARVVKNKERKRFEQKRHEDELRKQEEINQLKFKFFTNVSHDLRTPLTLIVTPLDAMLKESTDVKQTKRLTLMRNNAMRLLTLVNQLLDFRKTEMAELRLNPAEGDIVSFAKNVCSSFLNMSERKNINLSFYSDRDKIELSFDADKMEKILMNLLGNAFKFTPSGGRVDVTVECIDGDNSMLRIKVADTGKGVADKDKPHIFERFYQVDDDGFSHTGMGSGIGLSMVSEYVRLHEGSVRVVDNVEKGSVFIIDFPMRHTADKLNAASSVGPELLEPGDETDKESDKEAAASGDRPVALVVDDNPDMTELIKDGIAEGFDVVTASDGVEALEKIKEVVPSIIVADLMMPRMDGIELCKRLKSDKSTSGIPIIILTAKHDLGTKVESLTVGADDYITKPFNLDVLWLRMKKLVELTSSKTHRGLIDPEPDEIKITPLDEKFIEKAVNYVSDNIDRSDLSVEELSDKLGMSRVRLYKKIKQITGKTPIEFIRVIRLKRAAQLLRESQLNISEIAYQTGFNNPKVFSKYFKEEFGVLPSIYQENEGCETNYTI